MTSDEYQDFYDSRRDETYGRDFTTRTAESHAHFDVLKSLIKQYGLEDKRCLEIGSSGGMFQDMVEDYYGTDVSEQLGEHYHKPYRAVVDGRYPFDDEMFDAIWTFVVFEHIPDLHKAMLEVKRLTKPGGIVIFRPAWQCRSWAPEGYAVRPYSDFGLLGKLIKFSIPFRDSVIYRSLKLFPKRAWRHLQYALGKRFAELKYTKIKANYETYWTSDSDACNSIDPHDAILWFESNGFDCLSHPLHRAAYLVRTGTLVLRKHD